MLLGRLVAYKFLSLKLQLSFLKQTFVDVGGCVARATRKPNGAAMFHNIALCSCRGIVWQLPTIDDHLHNASIHDMEISKGSVQDKLLLVLLHTVRMEHGRPQRLFACLRIF